VTTIRSVADGDEQMWLAFSELFLFEPNLGIRTFHSLIPRLNVRRLWRQESRGTVNQGIWTL